MGIRMLHRRTAHARVDATSAAKTQVKPDTPPSATVPARAPGAASPRVPRTARTTLRDAVAPARRGLTRLWDSTAWQVTRGYLDLALTTLERLPRPRRTFRIVLTPAPAPASLTERPDGFAPR
ncbi:hypothetical protein [Streptomyces longwoodensis]|uniref:hypothetical protein n=1 Tax=Streptomyces longwoodensis TaxID=68231 RepID=UPI00381A0B6D